MAKDVFYSFHYKPDCWRVSQVKQMGVVEGQPLLSSNDWEEVQKGGDKKVEEYIEREMKGKDCLVVLIGAKTAGRKWVNYEISKAWEKGMGLLGVHIHNLANSQGDQADIGKDPFATFTVDKEPLTKWAKCKNPPYSSSKYVYDHIKENLADWVDEAIKLRG